MSSEWPVLPLEKLSVNFDSKRKPVKEVDRKKGKYPYYGASGIVDYVDGFIFDGEYLLVAEDGENLRTKRTPIAFLADGKFWVNNHAHIIVGNDIIRTKFLKYSLLATDIAPYLTGAVMPKLTKANLNRIELRCPPLKEQDAIIGVLGSLDDRITLLRETNTTLEAMAQALFKSWFVDFDPVHAKQQGRAPEGMDAATAALFPDSFEESESESESELGMVPKGWKVGAVADLGSVVCGKTPPTSNPENYGDDVPFITIPDMHGVLAVTHTARALSKLGAESQAKKYLPAGSICVSCIATPGLVVRVTRESQTNQQINSVIPLDKWGFSFPLFLLRRIGDAVRAEGSGGSVFHNLSKSGFERISLLFPESSLGKSFNNLVEPIVEKIISNQQQSENLSVLRDTLLPRLISGQLRLPEVQELAEAASAE